MIIDKQILELLVNLLKLYGDCIVEFEIDDFEKDSKILTVSWVFREGEG